MVVDSEKKKAKMCMKRKLEFNDYEDCLINNKIILNSQKRFKSDYHNEYTEQIEH